MLRIFILLLLAAACRAEVVDRIAICAGTQVITELQLDEEMRVTAFLNRQPVTESDAARRAAADRLIDQILIEREMQLSRYPLPEESDVNRYLAQVEHQFPSQDAFQAALEHYGLTLDVLRAHLRLQLTMLRFIDYRFRPEVAVSDADIAAYYEAELRHWRPGKGAKPPSLDASRDEIRNLLAAQRADEALNAWLDQSRRQVRLVYLDRKLEPHS
jgi:hypothetical protein